MTEPKLTERFSDSGFAMQFLISVYLTLLVVVGVSGFFSTELDISRPFMIGEATAKGVDVASRITLFYRFLFIGLACFTFFYFSIKRFLASFIAALTRKQELQVMITLQVVLGVFNYFSNQKTESDSLFHFTIVALFILELVEYFSNRKTDFFKGDVLKSLFIVVISMFLVTENIFITGTILIVLIFLLHIKKVQKRFNAVAVVLSAFPVLLFLTVESTLIGNQNGFYSLSYLWVGSIVVFVFGVLIYIRRLNKKETAKIIYNWQAPLVIAGMTIFVAYTPIFIADNSLFEVANNLNPLMMSEVYQTTYFVDYISSHLLNDYVWMKTYVFFNGYQNELAPLIYYGLSWIFYTITIYYFLREYFKQHFGILLFMLFTPYLYFYFPHSYAFSLIPVIFLHRYFSTKENRFLWWFGITSTLTVFWRLDLGIATVGAALIVFVLLFFLEKKSRGTLLKIGVTLALFYGILFVVYYSYCNELIQQAIHYFGGTQGHGVSELVKENSNLFYFDYFILPVVIGLCSLFLLFQYKSFKEERFYWVVLFFVGFYFLNFQRGLVRHSFIEMNETYISSFGWVILSLMFIELFRKKLTIGFFGILLFAGFLMSIHTVDKNTSLVDRKKVFSVNDLPSINGDRINRSPENYDYGKYTKPVVDFLKSNLKGEETFFDFSNSPMLYYHTEKKIPAYFSQSLQYIVDLYLQKECVDNLKSHSIPLVVFNQTFDAFGDNIDEIPNKVRYHYIASYLIDNYHPSKDYGLFHLWKQTKSNEMDTNAHPVRSEHWDLGLIPMYWKSNKSEPKFKFIRKCSFKNNKAHIGQIESGDFIQLKVKSKKDTELKMWMKMDNETNFFVKMDIKEGVYHYKFPLCGSYYVRREGEPMFEFEMDKASKLLNIEIVNQSY